MISCVIYVYTAVKELLIERLEWAGEGERGCERRLEAVLVGVL